MIKDVEHFSFTVGKLEESLHFFCDQLGLEATPIMDVDDENVQKIVGMPGARLRISLVQLPGRKNIELIEYVQPRGKQIDVATNNTGSAHVAFEVTDIDAMYRELSDQGIEFVNSPVWAVGNDGKGQWGVCYLKGPDNITVEFIEKKA